MQLSYLVDWIPRQRRQKLAWYDEDDLFSPPSFDEKIYFDDTLPPIYDDYCDDTYAIKNKFFASGSW